MLAGCTGVQPAREVGAWLPTPAASGRGPQWAGRLFTGRPSPRAPAGGGGRGGRGSTRTRRHGASRRYARPQPAPPVSQPTQSRASSGAAVREAAKAARQISLHSPISVRATQRHCAMPQPPGPRRTCGGASYLLGSRVRCTGSMSSWACRICPSVWPAACRDHGEGSTPCPACHRAARTRCRP